MRKLLFFLPLAVAALAAVPRSESACCYFAAKDKDVLQPAQKAFITWDPAEKVETFTVQPKFEGNASDFGMVVPTPARPKLDEMPRDFFKALAVYTILEPMDLTKYKPTRFLRSFRGGAPGAADARKKDTVRVLETGVVGSLEYKILEADKADDFYAWLKDHKYHYSGDEATLDFYVKKKWFFTVMKIDPMQMKKRDDGSYSGEVTPTRFAFASEKLIYPLKITQISVKDKTEALFYVQAPHKVDLPGDFTYQPTWQTMWSTALSFAVDEKVTKEEKAWQEHLGGQLKALNDQATKVRGARHQAAALEWAKKLTEGDLDILDGKKAYNRQAPKADVDNLKILKGHLKKGQFVTKFRKVFAKDEMNADLELVRATLGGRDDDTDYFAILPTSPP